MRVLYPLLITLFLLSGLVWLAWVAELQSTVIFVLDKGNLYLNYTAGLGRFRIIGFRVRLASGHGPRVWKRNIFTGRYVPVAYQGIYSRTMGKYWDKLQTPYRSILNLGIHVIIKELKVDAKIGLKDDAAATALLCGLFSSFLQAMRATGTHGRFVPAGCITVRPVFGEDRLSLRLRCVVAIEVRQAVHILAKSLGRMTKSKLRVQHEANLT